MSNTLENGRPRVVGVGGTLRVGSTSLGAVRRALRAAEEAGAETELLDLNELRLPMYEPGVALEEYGPEVRRLVEAVREADAIILGTAAYHGTLAGVTKNALDFLQFLSGGERPYLDGKVVGLVATAGGDLAGANAVRAMVDAAHSLRGIVAPLTVAVPKTWQKADEDGEITDEQYAGRLDALGRLVAETAGRLATPSAQAPVPTGTAA